MKKYINIFCTIGPSSLNKKFLVFSNEKIDLLRINMSHVQIKDLENIINKIRRHSKVPICIDTEGAQIRTKVRKKKKFKKYEKIQINKSGGGFNLYPQTVFNKIKINDILEIGFDGLQAKVYKKTTKTLHLICINSGILETDKGVHVRNRNINLDYLTPKDFLAIKLAKKLKIENFALSFTNSKNDILKFNKLLSNSKKIFKIETSNALNNFKILKKYGKHFLIDRGDLSKSVLIENIPLAQRFLFKEKKSNTNISVATNFLESMIKKPYPTRAEVNDIFNSLEMGANGLVLAAETAIGKYPIDCVIFLKKMIKVFENKKKINFDE